MVHADINQMPLAVLVAAEKDEGPREGAEKSRGNSAVKASANAFLPEDLEIGRGERGVFGWYVGIPLLAGLYGIDGMHEQVTGGPSQSAREHTLNLGSMLAF